MKSSTLNISTSGEGFYSFTQEFESTLQSQIKKASVLDGMVHLFCRHTSCALSINESYDPCARVDLEEFLKHLAPRNLAFITHTDEGEDDSPSHMKTHVTGSHLSIPVENGQAMLGTWQGLYLCEFRDDPKKRSVIIKYQPDFE